MDEFYVRYAARLSPIAGRVAPISDGDWPERLGTPGSYADYLDFFDKRLRAAGKEAVLAEFLPRLLPGLPAGAFHALIMLAYAVDWGEDGFLAEALAYFSSAYAAIPPPSRSVRNAASPKAVLLALETSQAANGRRLQGGNIIETMLNLSGEPVVAEGIGFPDWGSHAFFPSLSREALRIYLGTRNFTALHLVTSLHALRLVSRILPLEESILDAYWLAFCLARLTIPGSIAPGGRRDSDGGPDWEGLKALAARSDDDHVIKLVYTCSEEFLHYRDPDYLAAARLAVGKTR